MRVLSQARIFWTMTALALGAAIPPRLLGQAMLHVDAEACGAEVTRMRTLLDVWPSAGDPTLAGRASVVAFGSSVTEAAFVPDAFDEAAARSGHATTSHNFGQLALSADLQVLFAARAARAQRERASRGASLVLFELTPRTFSRIFGEVLRERAQDYYWPRRALLSESEELWPSARTHPAESLRGAFYHHMFGDVPPRAIRSWMGSRFDELTTQPPCIDLMNLNVLVPRIRGEVDAFCRERAKVFPEGTRPPAYDKETRGFIPGYPRLRSAYERLLAAIDEAKGPSATPPPEAWEFEFDVEAERDVVRAIRSLQGQASRVVLVRYPENAGALPTSGPVHEAQARWSAICDRVAAQTGAPMVDLSHTTSFTSRDFYDHYHLVPTAAERASALLASSLPP